MAALLVVYSTRIRLTAVFPQSLPPSLVPEGDQMCRTRQTDRHTGKQTDRHTDRQTDTQTDRQTDSTTHFTSTHSSEHKLAAYNFYLVNRMQSIPITEQTRQQEWNTICTIARNNGFLLQVIHKLRNKIIRAQNKKETLP